MPILDGTYAEYPASSWGKFTHGLFWLRRTLLPRRRHTAMQPRPLTMNETVQAAVLTGRRVRWDGPAWPGITPGELGTVGDATSITPGGAAVYLLAFDNGWETSTELPNDCVVLVD